MPRPIELRNIAFVGDALRILAAYKHEGRIVSRSQLIEETLNRRPTRFYVDYEQARIAMGIVLNMKEPSNPTLRLQMWLDFADCVRRIMKNRPNLSLCQAIDFVLNFDRPQRYYISANTAIRLLRNHVATISYAIKVAK